MFKSIRAKLLLWYIGSLLLLISYILLFIHYNNFSYGIPLLIVLFVILAFAQFIVIYKITKSITSLSAKIKQISSKNLDEKVNDIKSDDEIGELATSFNKLLERLSLAFKREQQFIADVAHELKTPLATQIGSFEIALSKSRSTDEYKKTIEEALIESQQLSATLKDVLDLAWTESIVDQQNMTRLNLSEIIEDLYEIAQKLAVKKKIEVNLSNTKDIYILGFKDKLARAILNLIDNAIKYTSFGGKVEIDLEKVQHNAFIRIIDNGPGIVEEEIPYIFNRFYRGSKTEKVFGSGLGLAIAKSIISIHHGEIQVKSIRGKGTAFTVVIPLS